MSAQPKRTRQQRPLRSTHAVQQQIASTPRRPVPKRQERGGWITRFLRDRMSIGSPVEGAAFVLFWPLVALLAWMVLAPEHFVRTLAGWAQAVLS